MPEIIHGIDRRPLTTGKTLFDYADEVSLAVPQSCGRSGRCRECAVEVRQGGDILIRFHGTAMLAQALIAIAQNRLRPIAAGGHG